MTATLEKIDLKRHSSAQEFELLTSAWTAVFVHQLLGEWEELRQSDLPLKNEHRTLSLSHGANVISPKHRCIGRIDLFGLVRKWLWSAKVWHQRGKVPNSCMWGCYGLSRAISEAENRFDSAFVSKNDSHITGAVAIFARPTLSNLA